TEPGNAAPEAHEQIWSTNQGTEPGNAAPEAHEQIWSTNQGTEPGNAAPEAHEQIWSTNQGTEPGNAAPEAHEQIWSTNQGTEPGNAAPEAHEQIWSTNQGTEPAFAAARTSKPQQPQSVPAPKKDDRGEAARLHMWRAPTWTNGHALNIPRHMYHWILVFLLFFLLLPYWTPRIERTAESQAVQQVEALLNEVRDMHDAKARNSTAAKFDLHEQICYIDSVLCSIVYHRPWDHQDFYNATVQRYRSDHFDPSCPAVGCVGRPAPALPAVVERGVGNMFSNVSSELLQLDRHFQKLEQVLQDCESQQGPLVDRLAAIVQDWEREKDWLERCGRLLQRVRKDGNEQVREDERWSWLSWMLHQASIQSCQVWTFAYEAAFAAGAVEESSLGRWKTTREKLEVSMRQCNEALEGIWVDIAAAGNRCREVAWAPDHAELHKQLPESAVEFLETRLTCSGGDLARAFIKSVRNKLSEIEQRTRELPELAPIAAPWRPYL
ncbi:hypothetical protein AC579_5045, partial [Pseudocercospora musae]